MTGDPDPESLDDALDALVRKEMLALDSDPRSPERGQYRFVQAMLRGVAYETLSRRDRKARHLLAAEYLAHEPDADAFTAVLAHHYLDAREAAPDDADAGELVAKAVDLLERAAARARALGAPTQAQRHFLTALPFAVDEATIGRLSVGAASAAVAAGRSADALALAEQAVAAFDRAGLPLDSAYALTVAAESANNLGTVGDMPERLTAVYDAIEETTDSRVVLGRLAQQIGRGYFAGRAENAAGAVWADRATALADAAEDPLLLAESIAGYAAILMTTARPTMGLGMLRVALEVARDNDLPRAQLIPLNNLAAFLAGRDVEQARRYAEDGLALARRLGDEDVGGYLAATAGFIYWLSGRWDDLLALEAPGGDSWLAIAGNVYRALALLARGEPVLAPDLTDDSVTAVQLVSSINATRALASLADGDVHGAFTAAREAIETYIDFSGLDDDFPTFWCLVLDIALVAGEIEAAEAWLRRVADVGRGQQSALLRALVPYFRARVGAATAADEALVDADFETGASDLAAFGASYWHARCLLEHAEWLSERGRASEATALVDEADRVFTSLRATPWIERTRKARALTLR